MVYEIWSSCDLDLYWPGPGAPRLMFMPPVEAMALKFNTKFIGLTSREYPNVLPMFLSLLILKSDLML